MITESLSELLHSAMQAAVDDGVIESSALPAIEFERPRKREHGDWATNAALTAAQGKTNPRALAEELIKRLPGSDLIERVEVAGPGFLNFYLSPTWLHDVVRRAANAGSGFGRSDLGAGKKVNVEYISANPTGSMNVVNGRHAAVGDTISNLLEATGHSVVREYYINDVGRQMTLFARSLEARYLQRFGRSADLPEDGYQGEDITRVANEIADELGDSLLGLPEDERLQKLREVGLAKMLESIRASLERFGTTFDVWFNEHTLHERGDVGTVIEALREKGLIEERDGAVWFKSSALGDDKDRVVVKADGGTTYIASDMPYLVDKFRRGFDHLIYLWGADHHGTIARLHAAADALASGREHVEVRLVQIVNLLRGGESVRASKRAGVVIPLDELVDEVGVDAARYTFLTRSLEQPVDFDIALVKEQAPENPVYYVQYAHARICSILRKADEEGHTTDPAQAPLERLEHPSEDELMRKLASFEEEVIEAANRRSPQRITRYVEELASSFSSFYRDCKVITDDEGLTSARLGLCIATRSVIAAGLGLLGVGAPEKM
ncbi:MAG TPA: arginine--tRNA ligase [Actinomycetota bacterium]|nr:arginine--tRNA ligase [Actinomycetota bacterium]